MLDSTEDKNASNGYCTQCGSPLEKGARFCTNCGNPIETDRVNDAEDHDEVDLEGATEAFDPIPVSLEAEPHSMQTSAFKTAQLADGRSEVETEKTNEIPLKEVVSADEVATRSVEQTHRIPTVFDAPTAEQRQVPYQDTSVHRPAASQFVMDSTAELPVAETLKRSSQQGVSYSAHDDDRKGAKGKKIALIAVIALVAIAALIAIMVFVFGIGASSQGNEESAESVEQASTEVVVDLSQSYSTKFASENSVSYPTFTFEYPSNWSITDELVTVRGETVELTNETDGTVIAYEQRAQSTSSSDSVTLENMEKVANAAFVPTRVQGSDYSDLGDFIVVKGMLDINGRDQGTCFALVPASAMHSAMDLDLRCGVPGFWYASTITFTCQPEDSISDQTEQEIIAILASFAETSAAQSDEAASNDDEKVTVTDDYVLPDSSSRTYSESELSDLSNYELYIARNEIFARHGRMFNNEDLQEYFASKSWYDPTIAPEDFDDSMLSSTEKKNIETISKLENERGSTYVN